MSKVRLEVSSHGICVKDFSPVGKQALANFCRTLAQLRLVKTPYGTYEKEIVKTFATATANRSEYRFHRHLLEELIRHLQTYGHYRNDDILVHYKEQIKYQLTDFVIDPGMIARDYQIPIVKFLTLTDGNDKLPKHRRVVTLQTGKGKTFCALAAIAQLGLRTAIVIKGMYIKKWIADVEAAFKKHKKAKWKTSDLMVIRGSRNLIDAIELAKEGRLTAKVIIISNTTLQMFINDYEVTSGNSQMYGCTPDDLYPLMGVGLRLIDELHQDFHFNFKQDLYTHVQQSIELSATMTPDDKFLDRMYYLYSPKETRYHGGEYDAYISAGAIMYGMEDARKFRCSRRGQYSHIMFEQQIMKQKRRLDRYLSLIERVVQNYFASKYKPKQKLLVFAATVEFCKLLSAHLQKVFPEFKSGYYVSGIEYSTLMTNDITVSTPQSAGTAVDIPDLRTVAMTVALDTTQGNEQILGRLRRLKSYPDVVPEFLYFVCEDIPKHVKYHHRKLNKFSGKVVAHKEIQSGYTL